MGFSLPTDTRPRTALRWSLIGLVLLIGSGSTACSDYDFERDSYDRGTLGEELYAIWHRDASRAPDRSDARATLLESRKTTFIDSVDRMVPPGEVERFDAYLRRIGEPIETGVLPSLTRKVRIGLEAAAERPAVAAEMAGGSRPAPSSFVGPTTRSNPTAHLAQYDRLGPATRQTVDYLLASDGFVASGERDAEESTAFLDLQYAAADALQQSSDGSDSAGSETGSPDAPRLPVLLRDTLLVEDARFVDDSEARALRAARYDRRGFPSVATDQNGGITAPFVDQNGDGYADVDQEGRFKLRSGDAAAIPPFATSDDGPVDRDGFDRAVLDGRKVFDYVDLRRTGLHFTIRQLGDLNAEGVFWDVGRGLPALFGDRTEREDEHGRYRGYSSDQPFLQAVRAALDTFAHPQIPQILRGLADFLNGQDHIVAAMVAAVDEAVGIVEETPDAQLTDDSTITYDLLPLIEELAAHPELWRDVVKALRDPVVRHAGDAMATMIRYRDPDTVPPGKNSEYNQCFLDCRDRWASRETDAHPNGIGRVGRFECIRSTCTDELFTEETDFDQPDGPENRSTFQQLLHLLRDTAGAPYELNITEADVAGVELEDLPPVVKLPGAAEAFVRTIAGKLDMKNYISDDLDPLLALLPFGDDDVASLLSSLSALFGTELDQKPSPSQITRLFNQPDLKFESSALTVDISDPVCHDGYVMANHHADKLFAAEASGLIDTIQPVARAFAKHEREDLFLDLFEVFHDHYSEFDTKYEQADGSPSPMKGANLVSYEPALHQIAADGDVFRALNRIAKAIDRVKPVDGKPFVERLRQLVHRMVRTDDGYSGDQSSETVDLPDGRTVEPAGRAHFLLEAAGEMAERLEDDADARDHLRSAVGSTGDVLFSVEGSREEAAFERPGSMALLVFGMEAFATYADHLAERDDVGRIGEAWPDAVQQFVASRGFPAALELTGGIAEKDRRRQAIQGFADHLLGTSRGTDVTTVWAFQRMVDAADAGTSDATADLSGNLLDPAREWDVETRRDLPLASHALTVARRFLATRNGEEPYGLRVAERGLAKPREAPRPLPAVGSIIADYFRENPTADGPYSPRDYRLVFEGLAEWFGDEAYGLEQLYDIVTQGAR